MDSLFFFLLALNEWVLSSLLNFVKSRDGHESRVVRSVTSKNPAEDLEHNSCNTTNVSDEVHEEINISRMGHLIYCHSEVDFSDKSFCSCRWVWKRVRIVENIVVKWVLQIFRNDPSVLPIKLVIPQSETKVTVDVVHIDRWEKDLVLTNGDILKCDEVDL